MAHDVEDAQVAQTINTSQEVTLRKKAQSHQYIDRLCAGVRPVQGEGKDFSE